MLKIGIYIVLITFVLLHAVAWGMGAQQSPSEIAVPQMPPVEVVQSHDTLLDILRLYVFPAVGALLMGIVAIILEKLRRVALSTRHELQGTAQAALITAAAAKVQLEEAETKHWTKLDSIESEVKKYNGFSQSVLGRLEEISQTLRKDKK